MTAFDPGSADWLLLATRDVVGEWDGVEETTMFGCPSFRVHGTLFLVLKTEGIALTKLPEADRDELESTVETAAFTAHGRTVEKWVFVPTDDETAVEALRPYIESSYDAAKAAAT